MKRNTLALLACFTLGISVYAQEVAAPASPIKDVSVHNAKTSGWTVLREGSGEKVDFTWKNKVGDSKVYRATMRMTSDDPDSQSLHGNTTIVVEFSSQVTSIEADGTLVIATTVLSSDLHSEQDNPEIKAVFSKALVPPKGTTNIVRLDPQQATKMMDIASAQQTPSDLNPKRGTFFNRLLNGSSLLPDQSASPGASWSVTFSVDHTAEAMSLNMSSVAHASLLSVKDGIAEVCWTSSVHTNSPDTTSGIRGSMVGNSIMRFHVGDALPDTASESFRTCMATDLYDASLAESHATSIQTTLEVIPPEALTNEPISKVELPPTRLYGTEIDKFSRDEAMKAWADRKKYLAAYPNAEAKTRSRLEMENRWLKDRMEEASKPK